MSLYASWNQAWKTWPPFSVTTEPWRSALQPPADLHRLLAPRSAWAILGLASGEPAFAARVAEGL